MAEAMAYTLADFLLFCFILYFLFLLSIKILFFSDDSTLTAAKDPTVNRVSGPVIKSYESFEEANEVYMNQNFPDWRDGGQTFVVPPLFKYTNWSMPQKGSNIHVNPKLEGTASDQFRGDQAEEKILSAFAELQRTTGHHQPMFIFHNFKFKDLVSFMKSLKRTEEIRTRDTESDLIIVHRDIGVILVETKAMKKYDRGMYNKAKDQLEKSEKLLTENFFVPGKVVKKVIACPNLQSISRNEKGIIHLCKGDLNNFVKWWHDKIKSKKPDTSCCITTYRKLVPALLCGRADICISVNMSTVKLIYQHKSLEHFDRISKAGKKSETIKKPETKKSETRKKKEDTVLLYLTPEQHEIWNKPKQVICGPYGCGKTILLQCKAMILARCDNAVLVIVPLHLKAVYEKFFADNLDEYKIMNVKLYSVEEFYNKFDDFKKLAKASHVFVDELLWRYVKSNPSCGGLTYYSDTNDTKYKKINQAVKLPIEQLKVGIKFLNMLHDLFKCSDKYVWIVPTLYAVLSKVLVDTAPEEVFHFEKLFPSESFSDLNTIMRTCKEVHEYKAKNEFQDFYRWGKGSTDEYIKRVFIDQKHYKILFQWWFSWSFNTRRPCANKAM